MKGHLIKLGRLAAAGLLAGAVGYGAMPSAEGYSALVLAGLVGIMAGTVAGSWPVVLVVPAVLFGAAELWHRLEAVHAPRWSPDDTVAALVIVQLILAGAAMLGSTVGILLSWLVAKAMGHSTSPRRAT
jgi:hypothetical protein